MRLLNISGEIIHEDSAATSTADLVKSARIAEKYLAGANLAGADLAGADLADANLAGAIGIDPDKAKEAAAEEPPEVPVIPRIHSTLLEAIKRTGCALDMNTWHTCETTHCRAGWVVHLAGEAGKKLKDKVGTPRAASMIYRKSDPGCRVPHWFATTDRAMADIEKAARLEGERAAP